jgi:membrane-associated phospholipid phosphatase
MTASPQAHWLLVTHLGAAGFMLPMLAIMVVELWIAGQRSELRHWMVAMSVGILLVLASKVAFIAWGWGSAALDFTGISGHTMLASSVFPVWLGWLLAGADRRFSLAGLTLGLAVGAAVGWSRLVLGAHSPSEAILGWLVGTGVSLAAYGAMQARAPSVGPAPFAAAVLLLGFSPVLSGYLPTHQWEVKVALVLSGHARPHVRQDLYRPALSSNGRVTPPSRAAASATAAAC